MKNIDPKKPIKIQNLETIASALTGKVHEISDKQFIVSINNTIIKAFQDKDAAVTYMIQTAYA